MPPAELPVPPVPPAGPVVSVVIPARDAAATLGALLDDLAAMHPGRRAGVIVVDDASTDGTAALAASHAAAIPGLQVVRGEGRGPAAARNVGARASAAPWLAFTDADVRLPPDWLDTGIARATGDVDVIEGVVRPEGGDDAGLIRHWAVSDGGGGFVTANLWVRRAVFDEAGGFDERYRVPWREDTDLGWRLLQAGARAETCAALVVLHPIYRRRVRTLFREGRRIDADSRLRRRFPQQARALQPSRERRRSYVATATLAAGAVLAVAGLWLAAIAALALGEALAVWAVLPVAAFRGMVRDDEWLLFALVAPALVIARTWWITRSNLRHRTWFW